MQVIRTFGLKSGIPPYDFLADGTRASVSGSTWVEKVDWSYIGDILRSTRLAPVLAEERQMELQVRR